MDPDREIDLEVVHRHTDAEAELGLRSHFDAEVARRNPAQVGTKLHVLIAAIDTTHQSAKC